MKDYYSILDIDPDSSQDEIKSAYRTIAMRSHPDRGGDAAFFCQINEAYETLSDPDNRRHYDRQRAQMPFAGESYRVVIPVIINKPADIFDDIVDVLSRRFGINSIEKLNADIYLSSDEARNGTNLKLDIPLEKICDNCFGFGDSIFGICRICGGGGSLKIAKRIFARIPSGVKTGDVVNIVSGVFEINGRIIIE